MTVSETFPWPEKLPALRSTGTVLHRLESSDIPALNEIFGDPEVMRYWSSPPLDSAEATANLLDRIHLGFSDRRVFQWGIADSNSGTVIGTCTLLHFEPVHRRCEIGFALARNRWGRGPTALRLVYACAV